MTFAVLLRVVLFAVTAADASGTGLYQTVLGSRAHALDVTAGQLESSGSESFPLPTARLFKHSARVRGPASYVTARRGSSGGGSASAAETIVRASGVANQAQRVHGEQALPARRSMEPLSGSLAAFGSASEKRPGSLAGTLRGHRSGGTPAAQLCGELTPRGPVSNGTLARP